MRLRWTVPAAEDLESIKNYLDEHYPKFAEPTVRTIYQAFVLLKPHPTAADPATVAAQENWRLHLSLTLSSAQ